MHYLGEKQQIFIIDMISSTLWYGFPLNDTQINYLKLIF